MRTLIGEYTFLRLLKGNSTDFNVVKEELIELCLMEIKALKVKLRSTDILIMKNQHGAIGNLVKLLPAKFRESN